MASFFAKEKFNVLFDVLKMVCAYFGKNVDKKSHLD